MPQSFLDHISKTLNEIETAGQYKLERQIVSPGVVAWVGIGLLTDRFVSSLEIIDAAQVERHVTAQVREEAIPGDKLGRV
jgi:hypothetical protein